MVPNGAIGVSPPPPSTSPLGAPPRKPPLPLRGLSKESPTGKGDKGAAAAAPEAPQGPTESRPVKRQQEDEEEEEEEEEEEDLDGHQ